ncbi:MAG: hypothetical protein KK482_29605 [Sinorhizobium meliloti]|uniref:hypothetical protein n=1 Tax=Ensifer sesbaniae TaxID=1214071 RepID=UPI001569D524|nr:hypothetical protein [Ensifer sesbaniae]MCG5487769.1 hypothetical protein [Sinorhizobium meliloti]NRQ19067.1 hypothetical protein [Ensifer sesbaniae]
MAIDAVGSHPGVFSHVVDGGSAVRGAADRGASPAKTAPSRCCSAAIEALLPSMVSDTLMLNNSLFNFAKEAIDEGDEG